MDVFDARQCVSVAVSGGADSLYSLVLLRKKRVRVFALHGLFFEHADVETERSAAIMRECLARTCGRLGVSLHVVDLRESFLGHVIRPFVQNYAQGLTPNPCALCNAHIKFGLLLDAAHALGADRMATGHYARLRLAGEGEKSLCAHSPKATECANIFPALYQGEDSTKDQSYFLSLVPRHRLAHACFPLAGIRKRDVLATLAREGISPPLPKESQEICFVPGNDYRAFLSRMAKRMGVALPGAGPVLLQDGTRVGTHKGLWQYTEGQRRGLGIAWKTPLYVLSKECENNILYLGDRVNLCVSACQCDKVNLLVPEALWPKTLLVKTRYREQPKAAHVFVSQRAVGDGKVSYTMRVCFTEIATGIAPGQIAAIYALSGGAEPGNLRLLAGGIIARVER